MPVESFIDLLTYTFQATVFVTLTIGLGYFITGRTDRDVAKVCKIPALCGRPSSSSSFEADHARTPMSLVTDLAVARKDPACTVSRDLHARPCRYNRLQDFLEMYVRTFPMAYDYPK